ncbi:ubiA prenyltransferase family domain-containing protein [Phthorimaea operculella]|nr:ubiA prenyltransferase family domain-containing protein [Phthorimaea operculella]
MIHSCICGKVYKKHEYQRNGLRFSSIRVHSTSSDQHRQKVVIETSNPDEILRQSTNKTLKKSEDILAVWRAKIDPYAKLARWDKPIGVYLLYWPCAWSIAIASVPGTLPLTESVSMAAMFFAGAVLMRGAGCTINDLWDRDVDAKVERTKDRPLVSGAVSTRQAVGFLAAQLGLALGILLQLNCYSVVLGASSLLQVPAAQVPTKENSLALRVSSTLHQELL